MLFVIQSHEGNLKKYNYISRLCCNLGKTASTKLGSKEVTKHGGSEDLNDDSNLALSRQAPQPFNYLITSWKSWYLDSLGFVFGITDILRVTET